MHSRSFSPMPWREVGLAILPGLFAIGVSSGLFWVLFGPSIGRALSANGLIALCILLVIVGFIRERRFAVWSFPALGILVFYVLTMPMAFVSSLFDYSSDVQSHVGNLLYFTAFAAIAVLVIYQVQQRHGIHIPRLGWALLFLIVLVSAAEGIRAAIIGGNPDKWIALLYSLPFFLWSVGMILLPIVIGLPLAWRSGLLAGLLVVATGYVLVDQIFDPDYALLIWTSNVAIEIVVSIIPAVFFLVISPVWVLRSHSMRGRVLGLLLPAFMALVSGEVIRSAVLEGTAAEYSLEMWLIRGKGAAEFVIALALAVVMYHWIERQGQPELAAQENKGTLGDPSMATAQDMHLAAPAVPKPSPYLSAKT